MEERLVSQDKSDEPVERRVGHDLFFTITGHLKPTLCYVMNLLFMNSSIYLCDKRVTKSCVRKTDYMQFFVVNFIIFFQANEKSDIIHIKVVN